MLASYDEREASRHDDRERQAFSTDVGSLTGRSTLASSVGPLDLAGPAHEYALLLLGFRPAASHASAAGDWLGSRDSTCKTIHRSPNSGGA